MIKRPGTKPAKFKHKLGEFLYNKFGIMWGVHPSERIDLIKPDFIIHNDSSVEQLQADLDSAMVQRFNRVVKTTFAGSEKAAMAQAGLALAASL